MKFRLILGIGLAFGVGWMSAAVVPPASLLAEQAPQPAAAETLGPAQAPARAPERMERIERVAQQEYGSRCSTSRGICRLARPLPLGSPCECPDGRRGTTIR